MHHWDNYRHTHKNTVKPLSLRFLRCTWAHETLIPISPKMCRCFSLFKTLLLLHLLGTLSMRLRSNISFFSGFISASSTLDSTISFLFLNKLDLVTAANVISQLDEQLSMLQRFLLLCDITLHAVFLFKNNLQTSEVLKFIRTCYPKVLLLLVILCVPVTELILDFFCLLISQCSYNSNLHYAYFTTCI
jgi:hypothetical protein